jgi:hypothetical protein
MAILLLLLAAIVLVFVAELRQGPEPAWAGLPPTPPLDRAVWHRLGVMGVSAFALLVAGLVAAYTFDPAAFRTAVSDPLDSVLYRYYWVMFSGLALYLVVLACGVRHSQAAQLFCLALPGALTMPVTLAAGLLAGLSGEELGLALLEFIIHPATWILPMIVVGQGLRLRRPATKLTPAGLARIFLIVMLYICTTFVPNRYS